jgi:hypothetical protein
VWREIRDKAGKVGLGPNERAGIHTNNFEVIPVGMENN